MARRISYLKVSQRNQKIEDSTLIFNEFEHSDRHGLYAIEEERTFYINPEYSEYVNYYRRDLTKLELVHNDGSSGSVSFPIEIDPSRHHYIIERAKEVNTLEYALYHSILNWIETDWTQDKTSKDLKLNLVVAYVSYLYKTYGTGSSFNYEAIYSATSQLFQKYIAKPFEATYGIDLKFYCNPVSMRTAFYTNWVKQKTDEIFSEYMERLVFLHPEFPDLAQSSRLSLTPIRKVPDYVFFQSCTDFFIFYEITEVKPLITPLSFESVSKFE
jgi:hypothetical protein